MNTQDLKSRFYTITNIKMWEYRIYQTDLGWSVYKKKEDGKLISLLFLDGKGKRVLNKSIARVFYTIQDAESALIVKKKRDNSESK